MYRRAVPAVLSAYGLSDYSVGNVQKGYRNESYPITLTDGVTVNLIFFKREPEIVERIRRADYVSAAASAAGLPVRTRFDKRLLHIADNRYAGLYEYLPGSTVAWEAMTMKHIKLLGQAVGELHTVLKTVEPSDEHRITDELLPLADRMKNYFSRADVKHAMSMKLGVSIDPDQDVIETFQDIIQHVAKLPDQQLIHMDMVRGNVLFDKAMPSDHWQIDDLALTGVIDFEKSGTGHPLLDTARTLAFLLVDSRKPHAKVYKYFLDSGYHKRAGQPLPDPSLLTPLVRFFLLHDFYKFLRHTPYESLRDNYHYTRTRDLLKTYGMISLK